MPAKLTLTRDNLVRLTPGTEIGAFDCGNADLNEFLLKDAKGYMAELLAVTYLVRDAAGAVALFFSLSNDRLTCAPAVIAFYQRNDFSFLTPADEGEDTRQMYFDLMPFAKALAAS